MPRRESETACEPEFEYSTNSFCLINPNNKIMRGRRFDIDLNVTDTNVSQLMGGITLLGDIKERTAPHNAKPALPPEVKCLVTGFPAHRPRRGPSKFKATKSEDSSKRVAQAPLLPAGQPVSQNTHPNQHEELRGQLAPSSFSNDGVSIDQENKQRLAYMSEEEIEAAKMELMSGLSPSLIEKLLKKANIDEDRTDQRNEPDHVGADDTARTGGSMKKVRFEEQEIPLPTAPAPPDPDPDRAPSIPPPDLQPASLPADFPIASKIHFPKAPAPPLLDPSDPDFLSNLHATYFPALSSDPSTLAWMAPISEEEQLVYSPAQSALPPSALRFDFRGHLLPPRLSSQISSTKGLHHHAHAPESAGYSILELALLARSAISSQRCIAYQTSGRLLYRLGRGDFGHEGDDLCEGLWELIEQGQILKGMVETAEKENEGNRSVWVTAVQACWLWRKGGGRRWKGR